MPPFCSTAIKVPLNKRSTVSRLEKPSYSEPSRDYRVMTSGRTCEQRASGLESQMPVIFSFFVLWSLSFFFLFPAFVLVLSCFGSIGLCCFCWGEPLSLSLLVAGGRNIGLLPHTRRRLRTARVRPRRNRKMAAVRGDADGSSSVEVPVVAAWLSLNVFMF